MTSESDVSFILQQLAIACTVFFLSFFSPAPLGVCPGGIPGVARRFVLSDSIHTRYASGPLFAVDCPMTST